MISSTVEVLTPQHWFNTSAEAPAGSVIKGHSFNITCSTPQQYPGASFQLRLIRSNGTVRQTLPALAPSVTFTFPSAQSSNEGYYYCLYRVQLGGRTFVSRESQPLPIAVRGESGSGCAGSGLVFSKRAPSNHLLPPTDPDPLLSPMVLSWLVSGVTFVIAVVVIIVVAKVLCNREKKPSELERETRTCTFSPSVLQMRFECVCVPKVKVCLPVRRCRQHVRCLINQQAMSKCGGKPLKR